MPATKHNPPFRAEHLGSLIRPARLIKAREDWRAGTLAREALRAIEDECVRDVIALQERAGMQFVSDGEFRKSGWRDLLIDASDGFSKELQPSDFTFTEFSGERRRGVSVPDVVATIRRREPLAAGFDFVSKLTKKIVKATLPAPSVNQFFRGDRMLQNGPYKGDRSAYLADVATIYRQEIADLVAQGCTYLQIDDVPSAVLCDPRNQQLVRDRGEDPQQLIDQYFALFNDALRERPANMTVGVHLCKGNMGYGQGSGDYEPVAERLFQKLDADVYFLEYDDERAGGFEPLRHLPKDRSAILGIISTKLPALEPADDVCRRIEQASKYVDLDRLGLSPQCGFASTYNTTRFTEDDQERKLTHLVAIAQRVWGQA
ncbi:MAG: 5-methyltetrahydropteroyltriglutamate--homocysteine S-methyltransferase [Betaproteobacteria bacterium]|nr:5-methyltetrahydropteroyltriglutamate--homocysteine S-methyltransferase [Betaproteobacteria bacterium]